MKRTTQQIGRRARGAFAVVEVMLAVGLLFITAWTFLELGIAGYRAYLDVINPFVIWPLG